MLQTELFLRSPNLLFVCLGLRWLQRLLLAHTSSGLENSVLTPIVHSMSLGEFCVWA